MRLYTLNNTGAVVDPESGETFQVERDGSLEVPDALGTHLLNTHFNGEKVWETGGERSIRLHQEAEDGRRDPGALLDKMTEIAEALKDKSKGDDGPSAADIAEAAKAAQAEAERLAKQADDAAKAEAKAQQDAEKQAEKDRKAAEAAAAKEAKDKAAAEAKAEKEAKAKEAADAAKAAKTAAQKS